MIRKILLSISLMFTTAIMDAQTITFSEDVACILNTHCYRCHNSTQSLAAIPFTNYYDAWSQRLAIKYYVEAKLMPPFSASTESRNYIHEKNLTQDEIDLIVAWVNQGSIQGDSSLAPPAPVFTAPSSQILAPDISYRIPTYTVPNLVAFQYHNFVVPITFSTERKISEIEILPSDLSAIYSVFLFSDTSSIPLNLDAADTSNGYEKYSNIGSPTAKLLYGWVNGNPKYSTPTDIALRLEANAHLVLRILFAEDALNKVDSTVINIKFDSTATRIIDVGSWLNHSSNLQNPPFIIPADSIKTFHEQYTVPVDVSLFSASHWAQKFCASLHCFAVTPFSDTIPILEIDDHEDLWSQGVYFFDKPLKIPSGSVIYGEATYDNTSFNPNNPFFPPHDIEAGDTDTSEQMLFTFSYLAYQTGDENIIADSIIHQLHYLNCNPVHTVSLSENNVQNSFSVFPNPVSNSLILSFQSEIQTAEVRVLNVIGEIVYTKTISNTSNATIDMTQLVNGLYFLQLLTNNKYFTQKFIKQ